MKKIYRKYWKTATFTVLGAGIGFAYWRFIGCTGGSCPLTANWHTSTLIGGLIGMLATPAGRKESHAADPVKTEKDSGTVRPDQKES